MMLENEGMQTGIQLKPDTVRQMLALYKAVKTAEKTYTTGSTMFKLRADHIAAAANARNVKKAFQEAAEIIGETL